MLTKRFNILLCALLCFIGFGSTPSVVAKPEAERREVQRHGYIFEKWVRDTFFAGYEAESYTQDWDVAAVANKNYGGISVSIKTAKYGTPVDLGDALRQYAIDEEFLLVIGYWQQDGDNKRWVNFIAARVLPQTWRKVWMPLTREDVQKLDAVVKDRKLSYQEARAAAKKLKNAAPYTRAEMTLNPKIDSKMQRRLQCSLSFEEVFRLLAPDADKTAQEAPQLFGVLAPLPFYSPPRG